jgi:hypothetical protein
MQCTTQFANALFKGSVYMFADNNARTKVKLTGQNEVLHLDDPCMPTYISNLLSNVDACHAFRKDIVHVMALQTTWQKICAPSHKLNSIFQHQKNFDTLISTLL